MLNAAIHPTPQELTAFALGKLADTAAATIARHLEQCPTCRQAIEKLPGDSFLGKVRAAKPNASSLPARAGGAPNMPATAAAPPLPPKDLPPDLARYAKYRFLRELGRGGMGVVYQAEQTVMGRSVAVKVINPSVLDHPDALPRFQGEVKAAAKLDHPNIVRAYDAEQVGSMHLLVMEYVEGTSLAELVAKKGPLSVPYACHYVRQAALGLQHAFEQGMVHRDIKPQNLMVNARGQVKVLDFGLARMRCERKAGGGLTQVDTFMGTPEYVSPEQATDARSADTRADIYSLGCTLFFLLTGRPPFQEDTIVKLVLAQIEKEPPALQGVRPEVPMELSWVVARMLAKDPAQRFQKPLEVADALAAFVKPGPKGAASSSPKSGASPPATGTMIAADTNQLKKILRDAPGKGPALNAPAKESATSVFAGLGEAAISPKKKAKPTRKAAPRRWDRRWPVLAGVGAAVLALGLGAWLLAGIVFKTKVKTPDGDAFVVLEIDQPNAEVTVDGQKINVRVPGDNKPVEIHVEADRPHKLRIRKDGFEVVTRDVELRSGRSAPIRVLLEPVKGTASKPAIIPALINRKPSTVWGGDWRIDGQELIQSSTEGHAYIHFGDKNWTDYDVSFETQTVSGLEGCKVLFRAVDPRNFYGFGIGLYHKAWHETWRIENSKNIRDIAPIRRAFEAGRWYKMRVEARGEQIRCFLDEEKLFEFADCKYPRGGIGLGTYGSSVRWKDIKVTAPDGKVLWDGLPELSAQEPKANGKDRQGKDKGFVPLFNGKDLNGWKTSPEWDGRPRVEDGMLIWRQWSYLWTERNDYEDFHLRFEARIGDRIYSQLLVRDTFDQLGRKHIGYAIVLNSTNGNSCKMGSLLVGGKEGDVVVPRSPVPPDQWFTVEVIAEGNRIRVLVNGQTTADYSDPERRLSRGHISVLGVGGQREANPNLAFRKIEIKELPAK